MFFGDFYAGRVGLHRLVGDFRAEKFLSGNPLIRSQGY
jgi:hypothetical protein